MGGSQTLVEAYEPDVESGVESGKAKGGPKSRDQIVLSERELQMNCSQLRNDMPSFAALVKRKQIRVDRRGRARKKKVWGTLRFVGGVKCHLVGGQRSGNAPWPLPS